MARKKTAIVKDNPDLVRDMSSNAIINNNKNAFETRKTQQKFASQKECEIQELKNQIAEINKILAQIVGDK
jgi:hypothetical protein